MRSSSDLSLLPIYFFADSRAHRTGLASALMRHYQTLAAAAGHPIWLEATTAYSRDIYVRLGFQIIDEIVLGKGQVAPDGTTSEGGEGVKVWGMLWRPEMAKQ